MEFTNDIYFDNNLQSGKNAKITYSGELYKNGSELVNLVSGFGGNWDYTSSIPMKKTENGFVAEIEIKDFDTFNFCFSNENNCWDNNNSFNYISPILPEEKQEEVEIEPEVQVEPEIEAAIQEFDFGFDKLEEFIQEPTLVKNDNIEFGNDYSSTIDDIIEDILGNTVQNSLANDNESVDDILNSITEEASPEIEALFNELFFEEQSEPEKAEVQNIENFVTTEVSNNSELVKLFDELFEGANKPVFFEATEAVFNASAFNLDGLVSDLLDPVINASINANPEESLFDNIEENSIAKETALITLSTDLQVSSRRLGAFYRIKKRLSIACYKLFVKVPKEIAKQLGFDIQ